MRIIDLWIFIISILRYIFPALFTPGGILSGRTNGPDGQPIAGVTLNLSGPNVDQTVISDAGGMYAFAKVASGTYVLYGTKDNGDGSYYRIDQDVTIEDQDITLYVALA